MKENADWTRHAGDVDDTIVVELSTSLGATLASVASVSATVRDRITGAETTLSASVSDSTNREVTVELSTWLQSTVTPGDVFYLSLHVVTTSGSTITFPEKLSTRPTIAIV